MAEHYFSHQPSSRDRRAQREIEIRGRTYTVNVSSGVFASRGLDIGTKVLLGEVPDPPLGAAAVDVGCGWGPLTLALADSLAHTGGRVWAVDPNMRARQLTKDNLELAGLSATVTTPEEALAHPTQFDVVWSNPPVRVGKDALRTLLSQWLGKLAPNGEAWFVIGKNLGADTHHRWLLDNGWDAQRIASRKGFRVLRVRHIG